MWRPLPCLHPSFSICDAASATKRVIDDDWFETRSEIYSASRQVNLLYVPVTVHHDKLPIKQPTRCIKYPKFILSLNSTCFGHLLCPSSGVIYCTLGNWYISCRLRDRFLAVRLELTLLGSGHVTCMKCTSR